MWTIEDAWRTGVQDARNVYSPAEDGLPSRAELVADFLDAEPGRTVDVAEAWADGWLSVAAPRYARHVAMMAQDDERWPVGWRVV